MIKRFLKEEDGMGVVEVLLIMAVLITMAGLFRTQISDLVDNIWVSVSQTTNNIIN